MKTFSPGGTKATVVYDASSNCVTLAFKQNKNYYYILALQQDRLVVFLQHILTFLLSYLFQMQKIDHISKYTMLCSYYL